MQETQPHYEAGYGIRPPRKSGKVRGVAYEIVQGGGTELWYCEHDHAEAPRAQARACARNWLQDQISQGRLQPLPVEETRS